MSKMTKRIILALFLTVSIPVIGYLAALIVLLDLDSMLTGGVTAQTFCAAGQLNHDAEIEHICGNARHAAVLKDASLLCGLVAVGLLAAYAILARICGTNRKWNIAVFPVLIPVSMGFAVGLVAVEGVLFTYAVWVGQSHLFGAASALFTGIIGISTLIGAAGLVRSLVSLHIPLAHPQVAIQLGPEDAPDLWRLIEDISNRLTAKQPDNLIVGLEPIFFATAADVEITNEQRKIRGETLYLSLPLMRLFHEDELRAVIGHELGHFRGKDTEFSLKFAPLYAGLSKTIESLLSGGRSLLLITTLPAISMLSVMLDLFAINVKKISRRREFMADKAAISVSSPKALATALGKAAIFSSFWTSVRLENIERLNDGKVTSNLSIVFEDSAKYDICHRRIHDVVRAILRTHIAHPTDTHPAIAERYRAMGFHGELLTPGDLINVGRSSSELIENHEEIEEALTAYEHDTIVAAGAAELPSEEKIKAHDHNRAVMSTLYSLTAALVSVDGKISPAEIQTAEDIGRKLFKPFDGLDFRDYCRTLDDIPDFEEVAASMSGTLSDDGKRMIFDYLKAVAHADEQVMQREQELLKILEREWGIKAAG